VGKYGTQRAEINISLTAINLLWNLSDYIAKESVLSGRNNGNQQHNNDNVDPSINSSLYSLWFPLFSEMKRLSADERYEVRNCAIQTLFKTITTHGLILGKEAWEDCIWKVIL
jgi:hypothetical protein